jgi:hypothetical protein
VLLQCPTVALAGLAERWAWSALRVRPAGGGASNSRQQALLLLRTGCQPSPGAWEAAHRCIAGLPTTARRRPPGSASRHADNGPRCLRLHPAGACLLVITPRALGRASPRQIEAPPHNACGGLFLRRGFFCVASGGSRAGGSLRGPRWAHQQLPAAAFGSPEPVVGLLAASPARQLQLLLAAACSCQQAQLQQGGCAAHVHAAPSARC